MVKRKEGGQEGKLPHETRGYCFVEEIGFPEFHNFSILKSFLFMSKKNH